MGEGWGQELVAVGCRGHVSILVSLGTSRASGVEVQVWLVNCPRPQDKGGDR